MEGRVPVVCSWCVSARAHSWSVEMWPCPYLACVGVDVDLDVPVPVPVQVLVLFSFCLLKR